MRFWVAVTGWSNQCWLSAETEFLETLRLKSLFFLGRKVTGEYLSSLSRYLWALGSGFRSDFGSSTKVFQRAYSAKPSLGLASIFKQGPCSGRSTSAHRCLEWNERFSWRLGAEQAGLVMLLGQCGYVCLGILLSICARSAWAGTSSVFSCTLTENTAPEADCTSLVCLSDAKGNLWNMSFLWDRPSGWAC